MKTAMLMRSAMTVMLLALAACNGGSEEDASAAAAATTEGESSISLENARGITIYERAHFTIPPPPPGTPVPPSGCWGVHGDWHIDLTAGKLYGASCRESGALTVLEEPGMMLSRDEIAHLRSVADLEKDLSPRCDETVLNDVSSYEIVAWAENPDNDRSYHDGITAACQEKENAVTLASTEALMNAIEAFVRAKQAPQAATE